MDEYDFVFAGGGMAGLSLAYALSTGSFSSARMLIVDPEQKGENDRTWSFWSDRPTPFDSIACRVWDRIEFASRTWVREIPLDSYRYYMIRSEDFYDRVLSTLDRKSNVHFHRGQVNSIVSRNGSACVKTDAGSVQANWVFDSRFDPAEYEMRTGPHHYLKQHFLGWVIETPGSVFREDTVTMFDFRTPQKGEMRFFYILPLTTNKALVEFTLFSATLLEPHEYTEAIEEYLSEVLKIQSYRVVDREKGVIPMTDEPVDRRANPRTLEIGTRGGRVKASTGYAFLRTQRDTAAIVDSLERTGTPFDLPEVPRRFAIFDTTMLQVMYRRGALMETVFTSLYQKNPIDRLFRFLDEETGFLETVSIMPTVPVFPFTRAMWRTQLLGKV